VTQTVYERIGVSTIINAKGPSTRVSGSILAGEVATAMSEASQHCVDMAVLQGRASEIIAEITGAESGLVTSGAAAGLLLGTAACVTGLDPGKMNRLPNTDGMKSEVVVARSHRNFYDHAVRAVGVKLVEVGISDRFSGAGVRDTEAWEIDDAISGNTAAVLYVAQPHALPELSSVIEVSHRRKVPVIVDAAAQLPPVSNLQYFTGVGADLVVFSGGKALMGPQASGMLCGRRDLIAAAALQNLDLDVRFDHWDPPGSLIDKSKLVGLPQHGIGRSCKVGKEEIVGFLTALKNFSGGGFEQHQEKCRVVAESLYDGLLQFEHINVELLSDCSGPGIPGVSLSQGLVKAEELVKRLQNGTPSVYVDPSLVHEGKVRFDTLCLHSKDVPSIVHCIRTALDLCD
tara:strand:- start:2005 stop:3207 length:1203 start_codon:yes stop_codon:yes gene_type:complete